MTARRASPRPKTTPWRPRRRQAQEPPRTPPRRGPATRSQPVDHRTRTATSPRGRRPKWPKWLRRSASRLRARHSKTKEPYQGSHVCQARQALRGVRHNCSGVVAQAPPTPRGLPNHPGHRDAPKSSNPRLGHRGLDKHHVIPQKRGPGGAAPEADRRAAQFQPSRRNPRRPRSPRRPNAAPNKYVAHPGAGGARHLVARDFHAAS